MGLLFSCCKRNKKITVDKHTTSSKDDTGSKKVLSTSQLNTEENFHKKFSQFMGDQIYTMLRREARQFFSTYDLG